MEQAFIDQVIASHSGRPGALLGVLEAVQNQHPRKYLPEDTLRYVAAKLQVPLARIYSVATFYALFNRDPQGEHTICICRGTACHARGSRTLLESLLLELGISEAVQSAGTLSDRIGGRPLLAAGLALQALGLGWLAAVISPTVAYAALVPAFVVSGVGMSLFFAPVANVVLGSVRRDQEGIASGATNAIRELGGVFGIAVLGAVFAARGGYTSGAAFVSGLSAAV